jgi:hypothetical protein
MGLEESFVHCIAREDGDWDCGEFIWTRAKPSPSPVANLRFLVSTWKGGTFLSGLQQMQPFNNNH